MPEEEARGMIEACNRSERHPQRTEPDKDNDKRVPGDVRIQKDLGSVR